MANLLIIKRISDDFDRFVCDSLSKKFSNVDVYDAFRWKGKLGRKIVNRAKTVDNDYFFKMCLNKRLHKIEKYKDVILFDDYPDIRLIQWIREHNSTCNIKLWFWNVPNYDIEIYRRYCQLYCFDQKFSKQNNVKFINQFYFDNLVALKSNFHDTKYDVSYIGVDKGRRIILDKLTDELDKKDISYKFILVTKNKIENKRIIQLKKSVSYSEVVAICCESVAILELVQSTQSGLTWRSLEALFFQKKLITNNKEIKKFDFYNKNNIFIYGEDNIEDLPKFLSSEFVLISQDVLEKYTVGNWMKSIMDT